MRKCSHCSHNGHNSRTCPNRGLKLFGVRLTDGIRKSASMGNLTHYAGSAAGGGGAADGSEHGEGADGYASEDFVPGSASSCRDRKKGIPWTEEEHRMFLLGLQKLGKGDWKGISRTFVISRTPTQVASHAQKYFIRQSNASRRKRRSSLFDIVADESSEVPQSLPACRESERCDDNVLPGPQPSENECVVFDVVNPVDPYAGLPSPVGYQVALPACFPPMGLFPLPYCSGIRAEAPVKEMHKIIRPTPVHLKAPLNIDELLGISKLSIGEPLREPMPNLSLKLIGGRDRLSAFHTNLPSSSSDVNSISSAVPAT